MSSKAPAFLKGKYTEAKDKAHGDKKKPATMQQDKKIDAKIIKGIKAKKTGKK
jgi:hypothetical protein